MTPDEEETSEAPAASVRPTTEITPAAAEWLARSSVTIEDQPPPVPSDRPAVWDLVIADMRERDRIGRERYGTPLQTHNGRDALVDAYQEDLDRIVYLRQEIEERRDLRAELAAAREEAQRASAVLLTESERADLSTAIGIAENEGVLREPRVSELEAVLDRVTAPALGAWQPSERDLLKDARVLIREHVRNEEVQIDRMRRAGTDQAVIETWQRGVDNHKAIIALLSRMLDG